MKLPTVAKPFGILRNGAGVGSPMIGCCMIVELLTTLNAMVRTNKPWDRSLHGA